MIVEMHNLETMSITFCDISLFSNQTRNNRIEVIPVAKYLLKLSHSTYKNYLKKISWD